MELPVVSAHFNGFERLVTQKAQQQNKNLKHYKL